MAFPDDTAVLNTALHTCEESQTDGGLDMNVDSLSQEWGGTDPILMHWGTSLQPPPLSW